MWEIYSVEDSCSQQQLVKAQPKSGSDIENLVLYKCDNFLWAICTFLVRKFSVQHKNWYQFLFYFIHKLFIFTYSNKINITFISSLTHDFVAFRLSVWSISMKVFYWIKSWIMNFESYIHICSTYLIPLNWYENMIFKIFSSKLSLN